MENEILVGLLLFIVAFFYSSVGHGGASGYLAVLGVLGYNITALRFSALILNVLVSSVSFLNFFRKKFFDLRLFLYLSAGSIPMAFLGAKISVDTVWYFRILALCLILAAWRLSGIFIPDHSSEKTRRFPIWIFIFLGAFIGFISGLIGIGGGIILSPILILLRVTDTKTCSGIAALFVWVNSVAGIIGGYQTTFVISSLQPIWLVSAVAGGFMGAYWGSSLARPVLLRRILAGVLLIASVKMIIV
ncbi:MAG: sulfite exporter TauE/SafE family protein [Bacteroidota bacterium]|nr:sulfite exporter TauE/SafE family protein [Bacteroidota bacterium]